MSYRIIKLVCPYCHRETVFPVSGDIDGQVIQCFGCRKLLEICKDQAIPYQGDKILEQEFNPSKR